MKIDNMTRSEARKIFKSLVKESIEVLHIRRSEAEKRVKWILLGGVQEEIGISPDPEDGKWQMVIDILMQIPSDKHSNWKAEFIRIGKENKAKN